MVFSIFEIEDSPQRAILYILGAILIFLGIIGLSSNLALLMWIVLVVLALLAIYYIGLRIDRKLSGRAKSGGRNNNPPRHSNRGDDR